MWKNNKNRVGQLIRLSSLYQIKYILVFLLIFGLLGIFARTGENSPLMVRYKSRVDQSLQEVFTQTIPYRMKKFLIPPDIKKKLQKQLRIKKVLPDTLILGEINYNGSRYYLIVDEAPSKTKSFLYALYLTGEGKVFNVDVLIYRENYGYEIDHPAFRKQFQGKTKAREIIFGRNIQNITGATISARSLTYAVQDWLKIFAWLKPQLQNGEEN